MPENDVSYIETHVILLKNLLFRFRKQIAIFVQIHSLMSNKKEHRGRIQAQGGGLEASENWAQDDPLTAREGLSLLGRLKSKIPKKEAELRKREFEKAEKLIKRLEKGGGMDAHFSQSLKKKGTKDIHVDIEILSGRAFIVLIFLAVVLFWLLVK